MLFREFLAWPRRWWERPKERWGWVVHGADINIPNIALVLVLLLDDAGIMSRRHQ